MSKIQLNDRPSQYVAGFVEFYKLKFKVDERALIPRPETELIVDEIIKFKPKTLLDIGTGAGNIAISAAKNLNKLKILATDVSEEALEVARINAKFQKVETQITFLKSDLLSDIPEGSQFDFIATNLPYIPHDRIEVLESSVKDFEPHVALDGGDDGFELYRKLFQEMTDKKIDFRILMGEIDYTHAEIAINEMYRLFPGSRCQVKLDLAHKQRFLIVQK